MRHLRLVAFALLVALPACAPVERATVASPAVAVADGPRDINGRFKDPQADPQRWVDRFEVESREVFARRDDIVAAVDPRPGERIADVGAGTGLFVEPFAAAVGESGKVWAVDIAPSLVRHMRERFAERPNVEVVLSEETSTTLDAAAVDAVFVCDTYHHFTHYPEMLASIHRALDDGGRLVVVDFEREDGASSDWILEHVRAGKAQVQAEIEAAGFTLEEEIEVPGLAENYLLRFRKR